MDIQYGILIKNCKILKLSTKIEENIQEGCLIYIFKEVDNNYIIQLFVNDHIKQEFYACKSDVVCKLLERMFNLILAIDSNELRMQMVHKIEFMKFVAKISEGDEINLNGKLFGNNLNTILKSKIKYIGKVPQMGCGNFIGIEFLTSNIPENIQQHFLPTYIKNCSKSKGILLSVDILEKYIVCNEIYDPIYQNYTTPKYLTEPSLLDSPVPHDFVIVPKKSEIHDEIENNKVEFNISQGPAQFVRACASNIQNFANASATRKLLQNIDLELNKINGRYDNFPENYNDLSLISSLENQIMILKLRNTKKILTKDDCGICRKTCNNTVTLKNCRHNFCLKCIATFSDDNLETQVVCPYKKGDVPCKNMLSVNEKNDLVTQLISKKYSESILKEALNLSVVYNIEKNNKPIQKFEGLFHCKSENCKGCWFINENDESDLFVCPICFSSNCLNCNSIHDSMNSDFSCEKNKQQKVSNTGIKTNSKNIATKKPCLNCLEYVTINNSIEVKECKHRFCKSCVTGLVRSINSSDVQCLYQDDDDLRCQSVIDDDQLNLIVSENILKQYKIRILNDKLQNTPNSVGCKTPDCYGWAINDGSEKTFKCPLCTEINCFICEIIHKNVKCKQYQRDIINGDDNEIKDLLMKKLTQDEKDEHLLIIKKVVRTELQALNAIKISNENKDLLPEDIYWAVKQSDTMDNILKLLKINCEICEETYSRNKITEMIYCNHYCCNDCATSYFRQQIIEHTVIDFVCPFCKAPDLSSENDDIEETLTNYFAILDPILKKLLEENHYEIFQKKVRDRALMQDPNFKWCVKCASGFYKQQNQIAVVCPECSTKTCSQCNEVWQVQHEGLSCEKFAQWKTDNDPDKQAKGVTEYLKLNGIRCPNCKIEYSLAKGGCLHFTCTQCKFEFCGCCKQPFKAGAKCKKYEDCNKKGIHAHHIRNCVNYMRDMEINDLKLILNEQNIEYPIICDSADKLCKIPIQKETPTGLVDVVCETAVIDGEAGLCTKHFKEYLCDLIYKNKVDPIPIMDAMACKLELLRNGFAEPTRNSETDEEYRKKCITIIKANISLN